MIFQECKCAYCVKYGFPALWQLTDDLVWFEIPKNSSSTVKTNHDISFWDDKRPIPHEQYDQVKQVPTVVVREPISRFLSLFNHYFNDNQRRYKKGVNFGKKFNKNVHKMHHTGRLELLINNLERLSTDEEVHHFYPQTYFIDDRFKEFKFIKLNELSSTFKFPTTQQARKHVQLATEQEKYIRSVYADDYKFFDDNNIVFK